MATKQATFPIYSVLHVTRAKGTLCGLPRDRERFLRIDCPRCEECLRLMEAELKARYANR